MILRWINMLIVLTMFKRVSLNTSGSEAKTSEGPDDKITEVTLKALIKIVTKQIEVGSTLSNYKWFRNERLLNDEEKVSVKKKLIEVAKERNISPRLEVADQFLDDQIEAIRLVQSSLFNDWLLNVNMVDLERIYSVDTFLQTFFTQCLNQLSLLKELELFQYSENCVKQLLRAIHKEKLVAVVKYAVYRTLGSLCLVMLPNGESIKIHATFKKTYPHPYFNPLHMMNLTYGKAFPEKEF